ncbi:MAG: EamA family transporter [Candidatus Woesearchaeota archaeon]
MNDTLIGIILVVFATFISAWGPIFMKKGSVKFTLNPLRILKDPSILLKNYNAFIGCGFFFVSSIIFVIGLQYGELSVLYPLTSLSYIWTCLISTKMLNERITKNKVVGIVCIIIGVTLIGLGRTV